MDRSCPARLLKRRLKSLRQAARAFPSCAIMPTMRRLPRCLTGSSANRAGSTCCQQRHLHPSPADREKALLGEGAGRGEDPRCRAALCLCGQLACGARMVPQGSGIIAFGSSFGGSCYMHGPAYGAQKAGIDKFAHDMEHDLRGTGVVAVSIWMGPLVTERSMIAQAKPIRSSTKASSRRRRTRIHRPHHRRHRPRPEPRGAFGPDADRRRDRPRTGRDGQGQASARPIATCWAARTQRTRRRSTDGQPVPPCRPVRNRRRTVPDRMALITDSRSATPLPSSMNAATGWLQGLPARVKRGDTVGLYMYNGPAYLEAFIAACKLGAVPYQCQLSLPGGRTALSVRQCGQCGDHPWRRVFAHHSRGAPRCADAEGDGRGRGWIGADIAGSVL
jgi:hypothetical protein